MQDKDTTKSTFFQLLKPVCNKTFCEQIDRLGVNKYIKKLSTQQLITLIIFAQLNSMVDYGILAIVLTKTNLARQ